MRDRFLPFRLARFPGAFAFLLLATLCAPALADPLELPAASAASQSEHHPGKVIWLDLVTPDLAGAKTFYAGLFGWTFREVPGKDREHAVALLDGRPVAGLLQQAFAPGERRQPHWLTYLSAQDVDTVCRVAVEHGARIVVQPRTYPDRGRQAILADPQGAVFAVLDAAGGDPPDYLAEPGEWIWSSIQVTDADRDTAFYQALFDYEAFELPSDDGLDHVILSSEERARASVNSIPADKVRRHPHWLNFVRVVDTTERVARAVSLGGRVLVEPHPDRHGGMVAVIADPSGTPVGLLEWTMADARQEIR